MLVYNSTTGEVQEKELRVPEAHEVAWIRLQDREPGEVKHVLGDLFHCHPLLVEDCIKLNQRPKLDRYKNQALLTFFALKGKDFVLQEFALVLGANYVITISKDKISFLDKLEEEFQQIEGRMDHAGDIAYHLLDRCVDEYGMLTDRLEHESELLERTIYRNPYVKVAQEIFRQKRRLHQIRRIIVEEKTILGAISHQNLSLTRQETDEYFIDIYDHITRVVDTVDIYRDSLSSLLELQMAMKSDRMNEIMKTLTIISSIFLPLTFIVGIYGMNFNYMPELNWTYGYFAVLLVMAVLALSMWIYYKRKKWL